MKCDRILLSVLVFAAMLIMIAAPATATENQLLFIPDDSSAPGYGDCVNVDIYTDINETDQAGATEFNIKYDSNCIQNYPTFDFSSSDWLVGPGAGVTYSNPASGICRITTTVGGNPAISGHKYLGTLTICCNDSCGGSFLNFTDAIYVKPDMSTHVPATDDGTFLCGTPVEVTKTVWDESTSSWVDDLGPLSSDWMGQDVTFQITVDANCLDLSSVVLTDVLDSGLVYNDAASTAPTSVVGQTITWDLGALAGSSSQTITFNATIDGYGKLYNTATATATVDLLGGVGVSDSDQASEETMPPAGIDVNKTVWDPAKGEWVEEINSTLDYVNIGDLASEAGHDLQGWSDNQSGVPYSGGNYGSGDDGTFRLLLGPGDGCDDDHRNASFTMTTLGLANKIQLRHLDGSENDNFTIYIKESNGSHTYVGEYLHSTPGEDWVTTTFDFPARTGTITFVLNSTGTITTWCSTYGQVGFSWAKLLADRAKIGDTYRFRCEMHNSGSPGMDLTSIVALDVLSDSLEYAGDAKIQTPNGVWRDINPPDINDPANNTVGWTIDSFLQDPLTLQPCQTVVIEFDATVVDYGYDCNEQIAMAWCQAADSDVEGNDTACIDTPKPDLTVTDITVNYDASGVKNKAMGPLPPGTKTQSNNISADITEINGVDITASFNVMFEIDGGLVQTVPVSNLAAGATKTVYCDNQFFPIAGVTYTITVTADTGGVIPETDEGNNDMDKILTAQVNGYKGDGWQDGRNITNLQSHEQGPINLVYSTGDSAKYSAYSSGEWTTYTANWTPGDFGIPATDSCIKKARLYVYYNYDKEPDGDPTDTGDNYYFNLTFNGVEQEVDQHYSDRKSFGSSDYTYGMIAYDVADRFMVTTDNHAEITYTWPTGSFKDNSMTGMLLVVVYNNTETEPDRIIWINEGYDLLYARDSYGVSSEEATTYAKFVGCEPIPMPEVIGANLITVAPHANEGGEKNKLTFNDGKWYGVWDLASYDGATELGIAETDVRTYLKATDNTASFQSHIPDGETKGDYMEASNAFLVVEKGRTIIEVKAPSECIGVGQQFDVPINVTPMGASVYGVEYELSFDPTVIHAEWQNEGTFLKQGGASTNVYVNTIDNSAGTVSFAVTRTNSDDGATEPGTLATIHFTAVQIGANTTLTLTSVKVSDPEAQSLSVESIDSTAYVCNNEPPVASAKSLFKFNNVGTKYMSKTYFDGSESSDPDGSITNYRWYFGDGNYGAGETYEHIYGSWSWNGAGYDPFEIFLTVEDDGTPMMDNSTSILLNVYIAGDVNGDGEVDIFDATIVGLEWDEECTSGSWDTVRKDKADLNNDCIVDIFDAVIIGANWDHTAW